FQAEDGIRYLTVTGVQTCALPIFADLLEPSGDVPVEHAVGVGARGEKDVAGKILRDRELRLHQFEDLGPFALGLGGDRAFDQPRSEERRVGEEWYAQCEPQSHKIQ